MVDINLVREKPEYFKKSTSAKNVDPKIIDEVLKLDEKRRSLLMEVEDLRAQRNKAAKVKDIDKGKKIKIELKKLEPKLEKLEKNFEEIMLQIPNPAAKDVKVGKDDTENEVLRTIGKPKNFRHPIKDHADLGRELDIIDVDRASKVSGTRFGYLKGDGALLEFALLSFAIETLSKEGFRLVLPPVLIKREMMGGMGYLEHGGEEDMYVLDKDGLILVGTSEQSIGPMHSGEVVSAKDLPLRYMGYSTCFRREAGSYGNDTRGVFRVHQFTKVEMFSFTREEDSDKEHEFLLSLEEKMLRELEIPYQVVKMCTGDLGAPASRKYDLEGWFPAQGKYRELTSTSNTNDFQSRRLNIKYQESGKIKYVHMLNGTAFSNRPILAILENYQQPDGSVNVPTVLQKWVGKKVIKNNK